MHREKLDITKHHKVKNWSNRLPTLKLMISCDLNTKLIHFHDDFRQKWSANPHFHVRTKVNNHTSIVFLLKTLKFHENLHFFSKISEKGRVWEKIHCYWDFWMLKLDRFDGFWWLRRDILLTFTSNYAPSRLFPLFTFEFADLGELLRTYFYPVAFFFPYTVPSLPSFDGWLSNTIPLLCLLNQ